MRVLIISHGHPSFSIGGAEVASRTLFQALNAERGQEAFYLSRAPIAVQRHAETPLMSLGHGAHETFMHTGQWDEFWLSNDGLSDLMGAFAAYLRQVDPDIVHFHHVIGFGLEALALTKRVLPKARVVVTFHEYLSICANHGQMVKTTRRELCRAASPASCNQCFPVRSPAEFFIRQAHIQSHLALADAFISPSRFLRDRYVAWGLSNKCFNIIENGVVGSSMPARPLLPGGRRSRFAFFGQISEFKGLHILLDAVGRVPDEVWGQASLSVFGGNLEYQPQAFQDRFAALLEGTGKRARFFGSYQQDELPGLMSDIDWVIVPSIWWENSPVVIQESFLHRRPLIVSGIGGMAEKVRDEIDGLHFRNGSPESLADKLIRALTDDTVWSRLSASAPQPPSPSEFAASHIALYDQLLAKHRATPLPNAA